RPGSERRVVEREWLRVGEALLPVEPFTLTRSSAVCAAELRRVMVLEALGEGVQELAELEGGFIREIGHLEDQTGALVTSKVGSVSSDMIGSRCWGLSRGSAA